MPRPHWDDEEDDDPPPTRRRRRNPDASPAKLVIDMLAIIGLPILMLVAAGITAWFVFADAPLGKRPPQPAPARP